MLQLDILERNEFVRGCPIKSAYQVLDTLEVVISMVVRVGEMLQGEISDSLIGTPCVKLFLMRLLSKCMWYRSMEGEGNAFPYALGGLSAPRFLLP